LTKPIYNYLAFNPADYSQPDDLGQYVLRPRMNRETGMSHCAWLFHADLFPKLPNGGYDDTGWIDETRLSAALGRVPPCSTVFINLEPSQAAWPYWHVMDDQGMYAYQPGLLNRVRLLDCLREERPDCRFGYYAQIPWPAYGGMSVSAIEVFRKRVKDSKTLTREVDFLVPEVYLYSDWPIEFTKQKIARDILMCREHCPGKPVYPILWCEYYDLWRLQPGDYTAESYRTRAIPGEYWREMLELAYSLGDGVCLWGGYRVPWQEDVPWWVETKLFLDREGIAPKKRIDL
jgi:hypothetical protein